MSRYVDIDFILNETDEFAYENGVLYGLNGNSAPTIDVPTKPPADVIGYRWKLKWVLEEAPDIIDALMERSSE